MKKLFVTLTLALGTSSVFASTPPELVAGIDTAREGNLMKNAIEYVKQQNLAKCEDYERSGVYAVKVSSGSAMDEKVENSTITYEARYLVTVLCDSGSTYSGAYRELKSAYVVSAVRKGRVKNGGAPLVPTEKDAFKVEQGDRRLYFIECINEKLSKELSTEYYKYIENETEMNKLFNFFKHHEITYNIGIEAPPASRMKTNYNLKQNKHTYNYYINNQEK